MRIVIQMIMVFSALMFIYMILSSGASHKGKAWKKIAFVLFIVLMVVTVFVPSLTDDLAHTVGVGSGANLLLYLLTLAFIVSSLNTYLKSQSSEDRVTRLARKVAILEAQNNPKNNIKD